MVQIIESELPKQLLRFSSVPRLLFFGFHLSSTLSSTTQLGYRRRGTYAPVLEFKMIQPLFALKWYVFFKKG